MDTHDTYLHLLARTDCNKRQSFKTTSLMNFTQIIFLYQPACFAIGQVITPRFIGMVGILIVFMKSMALKARLLCRNRYSLPLRWFSVQYVLHGNEYSATCFRSEFD
ncbi:hypothetical protein DPX16_17297 [Anabarilius grahami]|uniref:Uncharacterized protein n=1 Tax=Anabarilius grahami TaxID=495550 RepID=A0A3N0YB68_ANAGA|nr:hypothetical protein DPX16_17297 [Anabarilius grahami]